MDAASFTISTGGQSNTVNGAKPIGGNPARMITSDELDGDVAERTEIRLHGITGLDPHRTRERA